MADDEFDEFADEFSDIDEAIREEEGEQEKEEDSVPAPTPVKKGSTSRHSGSPAAPVAQAPAKRQPASAPNPARASQQSTPVRRVESPPVQNGDRYQLYSSSPRIGIVDTPTNQRFLEYGDVESLNTALLVEILNRLDRLENNIG